MKPIFIILLTLGSILCLYGITVIISFYIYRKYTKAMTNLSYHQLAESDREIITLVSCVPLLNIVSAFIIWFTKDYKEFRKQIKRKKKEQKRKKKLFEKIKKKIQKDAIWLFLLFLPLLGNSQIITDYDTMDKNVIFTFSPSKNAPGILFSYQKLIIGHETGYVFRKFGNIKEEAFFCTNYIGIKPYINYYDKVSIDVLLNYSYVFDYKGYNTFLTEDMLTGFSIDLGFTKVITNNILCSFHYDILKYSGRIGFGFKF